MIGIACWGKGDNSVLPGLVFGAVAPDSWGRCESRTRIVSVCDFGVKKARRRNTPMRLLEVSEGRGREDRRCREGRWFAECGRMTPLRDVDDEL